MDSDRLKLFRITDYAVAFYVLLNPEIEKVIYEDGSPQMIPDLLNEYWFGVSYGKDICGCFRLAPQGKVIYQIHTMFIPGFRRHAKIAGDLLGKWCLDNLENFQSMFCMVPVCFENVSKHAIAKGFEKVGTLRNACIRDGEIYDVEMYSISRKKIEEQTKWVESSQESELSSAAL